MLINSRRIAQPLWVISLVALLSQVFCWQAQAQYRRYQPQRTSTTQRGATTAAPYAQFRSAYGVIRWIPDQMPLKVYVSHGLTLDGIIDPELGAPMTNVDNKAKWPDLVASVVQNPETMQNLPVANGFVPDHYQAAVQGIGSWKAFEKENLFSFQFTDDPGDADIYVFWTNHFVNKLGLGLFAQDIRGYTSKESFSYKAIMSGKQAMFKPVVTLLRTTEGQGQAMPFVKMKASAAHEFGHALGIEEHSTNPNDLMSLYYGHGVISPNDAATIRYLYHLTPDLIP